MDPHEPRPALGSNVRTGVTILGPAFYRLNVGSFDYGSVVEERESLVEILALLDENRVRLTAVTNTDEDRLLFDGMTEDDIAVRVVIAYYRRSAPPSGWPDPANLLEP